MKTPFRLTLFAVLPLLGMPCLAQAIPVTRPPAFTADLGITFVGQRSQKDLTGQNFWLEGGSAQIGLPVHGNLATVIDFTGTHTNSIGPSGVPLTFETITFGPRYRFRPHARWSPYGQALFGLAIGLGGSFPTYPLSSSNLPNSTSFALQAGGGLDYRLTRVLSVRVLDAAYVRSNLPNGVTNEQNALRLGGGVVLRFGAER